MREHKIYHLSRYLLAIPYIDLSITNNNNNTTATVLHNNMMNDIRFRTSSKNNDGCYVRILFHAQIIVKLKYFV